MTGLSDRSLLKARRLLEAGHVREVTPARTFTVQGDHDRYVVTVSADGASCTCPAYGACSHQEAVMLAIGPGRRPPAASAEAALVADAGTAAAGHVRQAAAEPMPRLFTWSWRPALDADPPGVVLVRISLGKPRWVLARAARCPYIEELAPGGGLFHVPDAAEFRRRYWARLDGIGVDRIIGRLREVSDAHGGKPLVLLCFERDRRDCHRGDAADWFRDRLGVCVPEYRRGAELEPPEGSRR